MISHCLERGLTADFPPYRYKFLGVLYRDSVVGAGLGQNQRLAPHSNQEKATEEAYSGVRGTDRYLGGETRRIGGRKYGQAEFAGAFCVSGFAVLLARPEAGRRPGVVSGVERVLYADDVQLRVRSGGFHARAQVRRAGEDDTL